MFLNKLYIKIYTRYWYRYCNTGIIHYILRNTQTQWNPATQPIKIFSTFKSIQGYVLITIRWAQKSRTTYPTWVYLVDLSDTDAHEVDEHITLSLLSHKTQTDNRALENRSKRNKTSFRLLSKLWYSPPLHWTHKRTPKSFYGLYPNG